MAPDAVSVDELPEQIVEALADIVTFGIPTVITTASVAEQPPSVTLWVKVYVPGTVNVAVGLITEVLEKETEAGPLDVHAYVAPAIGAQLEPTTAEEQTD